MHVPVARGTVICRNGALNINLVYLLSEAYPSDGFNQGALPGRLIPYDRDRREVQVTLRGK